MGDPSLTPGSGRFPGEGNGNSLQYSHLENSMDRGAWWTTVHGVAQLDTTEQLIFSLSYIYKYIWLSHFPVHLKLTQHCELTMKNKVLVAQSCLTLCDPTDCSAPGSSVCGIPPVKNSRMGSHSLLQGIFLTQGSSPGFLHCRQVLYPLSYQGSP